MHQKSLKNDVERIIDNTQLLKHIFDCYFPKKISQFSFSHDLFHCTEGVTGLRKSQFITKSCNCTEGIGVFDSPVKNLTQMNRGLEKISL